MRSDREFAEEALRRAAIIKARRERKRRRLMAGMTLASCLMATVAIALFSERYPADLPSLAAAGQTPLFFPNAGGYVLCGIICFVLGVAVTLIAKRTRKRRGTGNEHYLSHEILSGNSTRRENNEGNERF